MDERSKKPSAWWPIAAASAASAAAALAILQLIGKANGPLIVGTTIASGALALAVSLFTDILKDVPRRARWAATAVSAGILVLIVALGLAFGSPSAHRADRLEIVDIEVTETGKSTDIDLKFRNPGPETAFMKEGRIQIIDARPLMSCALPDAVPSSYTYDVELPTRVTEPPEDVSFDISQEIPANGTDRFTLRLGTDGPDQYAIGETLYAAKIQFFFNEGRDHLVGTGEIAFFVGWPAEANGLYFPGMDDPDYRHCIEDATAAILAVLERPNIEAPHLSELREDMVKQAEQLDL